MTAQKVLLGVTGSIAAYKAADLASRLTQQNYTVSTILTEQAQQFITATTLGGVSGGPVYTVPYSADASQLLHIQLAEESDVIVIAPATANILAKMAQGFADDLLSCTLLATTKPVIVAPAMNPNMYQHPATQENIKTLKQRGVTVLNPESGHMACNVDGVGRYPDNAVIIEAIEKALGQKKNFKVSPLKYSKVKKS